MMDCPKCGHKQDANHTECVKCGVIFSKVIEREKKRESLKKQRRQISKREFEQVARSKFNKLDPGAKAPITKEVRKQDPSADSIAAGDLRTKQAAISTGGPGNRAFKIVFITLLFIIFIPFACNKLLDHLISEEHELEKFDLTFNQYHRRTDGIFKIPESSEYIDLFSYHMRDYWCNAIQAKVRSEIPDLHAIVSDYNLYDVAHPTLVANVSAPMDALAMVIGANGSPWPSWLQTNDPMYGYNMNVLKYGRGGSYGRGVWAFYDENMQTLRVFSWSVQHLPIDRFKQALMSSENG